MLDLNVVVSEIDWSSCELLAIECHIDAIRELLWIEVVNPWHSRDDLSVFEVALCSRPVVHFAFLGDRSLGYLNIALHRFLLLFSGTGLFHTPLVGLLSLLDRMLRLLVQIIILFTSTFHLRLLVLAES